MKLPKKYEKFMLDESVKNASFKWYDGWEKASGYIKSELRSENIKYGYGSFRICIPWEKKKAPTQEQIVDEITKEIENLLAKKSRHSSQRDFTHYILNTFFVDVKRLEREVIKSIESNTSQLLSIIEKSELFCDPNIQELFNDLKNFECAISDTNALNMCLNGGGDL